MYTNVLCNHKNDTRLIYESFPHRIPSHTFDRKVLLFSFVDFHCEIRWKLFLKTHFFGVRHEICFEMWVTLPCGVRENEKHCCFSKCTHNLFETWENMCRKTPVRRSVWKICAPWNHKHILRFFKSVPHDAGVHGWNFCVISLNIRRERTLFLKTTLLKIDTGFTTLTLYFEPSKITF